MKYIYDIDGFLVCATPFEVLTNETYTLIEPSADLVKPKFVNNKWVEALTVEEIENTIKATTLAQETRLYVQRIEDGKNAYAQISAEFRLAKLNGVITEAQHGAIEDILIPVRNEVLAGQWVSAKQKLEEIGNVIGVDLYNRLHKQISDYISINY